VHHVSFSLALKIICVTCVFSNMQELDFEKDVEPVGYFKLPPIKVFSLRILTIIFSRYYFQEFVFLTWFDSLCLCWRSGRP